MARRLAEAAPDHWVHFQTITKDRLNLFEGLPFTCAPARGSFFLEPWVEASDQVEERDRRPTVEPNMDRKIQTMALADRSRQSTITFGPQSTFDEFKQMLDTRGVDLTRFGKGHASLWRIFIKK
jgi:hypothetical protein